MQHEERSPFAKEEDMLRTIAGDHIVRTIAITIVVLVISLLVYAATRPDTFRVQRSMTMNAAPEKIFPLISDFRQWAGWSPWEKLDPGMKRVYSGPESGTGSAYAWEGNRKVGKGRMEITDLSPPSRIIIKLDFEKPMQGHNVAEFTLEGEGGSTGVTWAMYGPNPYLAKVMGLFFRMDKMIGKDFEAGLVNLKAMAEK